MNNSPLYVASAWPHWHRIAEAPIVIMRQMATADDIERVVRTAQGDVYIDVSASLVVKALSKFPVEHRRPERRLWDSQYASAVEDWWMLEPLREVYDGYVAPFDYDDFAKWFISWCVGVATIHGVNLWFENPLYIKMPDWHVAAKHGLGPRWGFNVRRAMRLLRLAARMFGFKIGTNVQTGSMVPREAFAVAFPDVVKIEWNAGKKPHDYTIRSNSADSFKRGPLFWARYRKAVFLEVRHPDMWEDAMEVKRQVKIAGGQCYVTLYEWPDDKYHKGGPNRIDP